TVGLDQIPTALMGYPDFQSGREPIAQDRIVLHQSPVRGWRLRVRIHGFLSPAYIFGIIETRLAAGKFRKCKRAFHILLFSTLLNIIESTRGGCREAQASPPLLCIITAGK